MTKKQLINKITNEFPEIDELTYGYISDCEDFGFDYEIIFKIWEIAFLKKIHFDVYLKYTMVETYRKLQIVGYDKSKSLFAVKEMIKALYLPNE